MPGNYGSLFEGEVINIIEQGKATECPEVPSEPNEQSSPRVLRWEWVVVICLAFIVIASYSSTSSSSISKVKVSSRLYDTHFSRTLTLRRVGYPIVSLLTENASYISYSFLEDYDAIIEPYSPMIIEVFALKSNSSDYRYFICPSASTDDSACQSGILRSDWDGVDENSTSFEPVIVNCEPYDVYNITVTQLDSINSTVIRTADLTGICLYVRRDIESLTAEDLAETMDAMHEMWNYNDTEGQAQFGSSYRSAHYFSEAHFFNAAQADSDHIHEGLGFLPQHIKLSNWFEQSMQAVNPKVSLPFWEFTSELPRNISIFESIMFSPETFGSLNRPTDIRNGFTYASDTIESGIIPDGRWAYLAAEVNTRMPTISSGYGLIRSPWNMNPAPYITRFPTSLLPLPTCTDYFSAVHFDDPIEFIDYLQKGPHASIHAAIGNVFGCDLLEPFLESGLLRDVMAKTILCVQWSYLMKDLYRDKYFVPKTGCELEAGAALNDFQCGYECTASGNETIMEAVQGLLNRDYAPLEGLSDDQWQEWVDFICTGDGYRIVVGAHMDSTSASDPSFWPAHPTQERLFHAKMMSLQYSDSFDWDTKEATDYVCDTYRCYSDELGYKDDHAVCCYGHNHDDQLLDFLTPDRYSYVGPKNSKIMAATNPVASTYSMPYVYENFNYSHCSQGIDSVLQQKFEKTYTSTTSDSTTTGKHDKGDHTKVVHGPVGPTV